MVRNFNIDIEFINSLQKSKDGILRLGSDDAIAQIQFENSNYLLQIDRILEFDINGDSLLFFSNEIKINISATVTAHRNSKR